MSAALSGPVRLSEPQLLLMMWGRQGDGGVERADVLTKLIFTIVKSASGATAKMLADSAVPWPISSAAGLAAPGPSTTGRTR